MSVSGIPSPLPPYGPPSVAAAWQETDHREPSSDQEPQRRHEKAGPTPADPAVPAPEPAPRSESIGTILDVRA